MSHSLVLSINAADPGSGTGIHKRPIDSATFRAPAHDTGAGEPETASGVVGDRINNTRVHGGDRQAVYAYASEALADWSTDLGIPVAAGTFGENLTTRGIDVDGALLGERWRVWNVTLEVTKPRVPCSTFAKAMSGLGVSGWNRRFTERARPGAYLRVVQGGNLSVGDPIQVVERPDHGVTIQRYFEALMGDLDAGSEIVDAGILPQSEHDWLAARVEKRGG